MHKTAQALTLGSREMILTVSSARPTARKRLLCSPAGTRPSAMHTTSDDISLRSVYSFSWPVCQHRTTTATDLHKKAALRQMWKQKIEWYICLETTRTNRKSPIYHTKNAIHDYKASTEHMQKEFSKKTNFFKAELRAHCRKEYWYFSVLLPFPRCECPWFLCEYLMMDYERERTGVGRKSLLHLFLALHYFLVVLRQSFTAKL